MPPKTPPRRALLVDPATRLDTLGLPARKLVEIRSSDYNTCLENPFAYFLGRRLSLTSPLRWSKALSRGSWFHLRCLYLNAGDPISAMRNRLEQRLDELQEVCKATGLSPDRRLEILDREQRDFACSIGWYEAAATVPLRRSEKTFPDFFNADRYTILGRELLLTARNPAITPCPLVAQIDLLLHDTRTNRVWALDYKTCSEPASERLSRCPIEFQSQHYSWITRELLRTGELAALYPALNADTTFGGMMHLAVQKPTIEFGMKDRPCRWVCDSKRKKLLGILEFTDREDFYRIVVKDMATGEESTFRNKEPFSLLDALERMSSLCGDKKPEKIFSGEPSLEMYIDRCKDWYHARGDYEEKAPERLTSPVVDLSWLGADWLDDKVEAQYFARLAHISQYAACPPDPDLFLMSDRIKMTERNPFAPFYVTPPEVWPEVIARQGLVRAYRDETLLPDDADIPPIQETDLG